RRTWPDWGRTRRVRALDKLALEVSKLRPQFPIRRLRAAENGPAVTAGGAAREATRDAVIKRRDQLVRLGLTKRKATKQEPEAIDPTVPAPAPIAPSMPAIAASPPTLVGGTNGASAPVLSTSLTLLLPT